MLILSTHRSFSAINLPFFSVFVIVQYFPSSPPLCLLISAFFHQVLMVDGNGLLHPRGKFSVYSIYSPSHLNLQHHQPNYEQYNPQFYSLFFLIIPSFSISLFYIGMMCTLYFEACCLINIIQNLEFSVSALLRSYCFLFIFNK